MDSNPLVSIIIPTYNRLKRLRETLNSVKLQTYTNWECLVIDDGSNDNTESFMAKLIEADKRFKYFKRPKKINKGANACRNIGLKKSKGKFVNFLDSDDFFESEKLELQVQRLHKTNSDVCLCNTNWYDIENNQNLGLRSESLTTENSLDDYINSVIVWPILAPLWSKRFLKTHNLNFDKRLQQSQEYDFHIRALSMVPVIEIVDNVLCKMIKHDDNMSSSNISTSAKVRSNLLARYKAIQIEGISNKVKTHLHYYTHDTYRRLIFRRNIYRSLIAYVYLIKLSKFITLKNELLLLYYLRITIGGLSYLIFSKGNILLKY